MAKRLWVAGLAALGVGAALLAGWGVRDFQRDMAQARLRVEGRSELLETAWGRVEYRVGGGDRGPPVLVVHGSGGGFDQGELLAQAALQAEWRWVAPSRFGYLRSSLPPQAEFDAQAQAYARLLDHLGIDRVAVLAFSHGGPSALLFAARFPQRVSALVLISAGVTGTQDPAQAQAGRQGDALKALFQQDWRYWGLTTLWRDGFLALMGADATVRAGLSPAQRALVDRLVDGMHPASRRAAGAAFDNRAAMPQAVQLAKIRAPTLLLHARDDSLQVFGNALAGERSIPGARLVAFDHGGHLLLAVAQAPVRLAVQDWLLRWHAGAAAAAEASAAADPASAPR